MIKFIEYQLHKASIDILLDYKKALISKIGDKGGIYILYKNSNIYYVGKATRLKQRIKQHFTDKHKNKWNFFSLYVVADNKLIPELERIFISLMKPSGNSLLYQKEIKKFQTELRKEIRTLQDIQLKQLFSNEEIESRSESKTSKKFSKTLTKIYKGKKYIATLQNDGIVIYDKKKYTSLTAAAKKVVGHNRSISGPHFWGLR
ncbi:DUF2924 domain-containing protein [Endomicrobium proavitum]|uniref:GIY-YIG domain-containing protein n=1 Tax=Endomicrobium proavitum TaxID=1408281 RepID=A0A0G3WKG0_9BACT|nr:DUF2924 domain-containing protein [Endomicrobium proavitum]AKL98372.1 hypothetical protein Epro_0993 [Endomicrobium proavitum]